LYYNKTAFREALKQLKTGFNPGWSQGGRSKQYEKIYRAALEDKSCPIKVNATNEPKVVMRVTIVAGKSTVKVVEGQIDAQKVAQYNSTIEAAAAKAGLSDAEFTLNLIDTANGFIAETGFPTKAFGMASLGLSR